MPRSKTKTSKTGKADAGNASGAKTAKTQGAQAPKKEEAAVAAGTGSYLLPAVIIIAVIAIAAVLGYIEVTLGGGGQQTLQSFQNSFYAAPRVAIYVMNSSGFPYSDNCANLLIEEMIRSQAHHRNASTIDLLVVANSTSCLSPNGALGKANGTKVTPIADCLAISKGEPSVFINYSSTNSTSIRSGDLYTSGDAMFLSECGIASELG